MDAPDLRSAAEASRAAIIPAIAEDGGLYPVEKLEAHRLGLKHLAISAFVFVEDRLIIQQRAAGKYHSGLTWANTVCSHPHWGEAPAQSALRRLTEEIGIATPLAARNVIEYRAAVSGGLVEHERVHVFEGSIALGAYRPRPAADEVAALRLARVADLRAEARATPEAFAPWFRIYLDRWDELGLVCG